jgi:amino acid transporter
MYLSYALSAAVVLCAEISAASVRSIIMSHWLRTFSHRFQVIIGYWDDTIHVGVWIAIILVVIAALNAFVVGGYGEAEFIFASETF